MSKADLPEGNYLTTAEAAKLAFCSTRTIWRWVKAGRLRPRRVAAGAQALFARSEVIAALEIEAELDSTNNQAE
jgi:excisionase family DNA binding protein